MVTSIIFPDRMVVPDTAMPGNVITVWVLILLSTYRYISGQGGIVHAALLLVREIGSKRRPAYCKHTGFARCCGQAPGLGCTETKLLLMVLL